MRTKFRFGLWIPALLLLAGCVQVESKPDRDPALCGNGELDTAEACDPEITEGEGVCPTECAASDDVCGGETLQGDADSCTAQCVVQQKSCGPADGCCPSGCNNTQDSDCPIDCDDPANSSTPGCRDSDRLVDLDDQGWRAFCDSLNSGMFTCSGGEMVEIPGGDECYDGRDSIPEQCELTTGEAKTCFDNPCALVDGGPDCEPLLACATAG